MRVHIVPAGDKESREHHKKTVEKRVSMDTFEKFLTIQQIKKFTHLPSTLYACWGITNGKKKVNYNQWVKMKKGDLCIFYRDKKFFSVCEVVCKFKNRKLAMHLWGIKKIPGVTQLKEMRISDTHETWENMFLLDNIKSINIPVSKFRKLMDYSEKWYAQRYQNFDEDTSKKIIDEFELNNSVNFTGTNFTFGHIHGVSVGDIFLTRQELSKAGIHGPSQAGIWGRELEGSCSIVLSGGYEDDIDNLDYILYTGQGGQDDKGKQVEDQEFTRGNKGLQLCYEYKLPVRVTRGYQIKHGPEAGYRYDGLYYITSYEHVLGKSGYKICRFHLESELSLDNLENKLSNSLPENYESPGRKEGTTNRIIRSVKNREKIKAIYQSRCQVCGIFLKKPDNTGIVIGAHIKGLGKPHDGPDTLDNMLCLCPNHHEQFDAFSFYIDPDDLKIYGLDDKKGQKLITAKEHKINKDFLSYHKNLYENNN